MYRINGFIKVKKARKRMNIKGYFLYLNGKLLSFKKFRIKYNTNINYINKENIIKRMLF